MKRGNRGKNFFIAANAFFWSVSLLKKSQKNYFGGRFSPTPVVEKWCPALYTPLMFNVGEQLENSWRTGSKKIQMGRKLSNTVRNHARVSRRIAQRTGWIPCPLQATPSALGGNRQSLRPHGSIVSASNKFITSCRNWYMIGSMRAITRIVHL